MTKNATYCDKHVSSRKCIFFVVNGIACRLGKEGVYRIQGSQTLLEDSLDGDRLHFCSLSSFDSPSSPTCPSLSLASLTCPSLSSQDSPTQALKMTAPSASPTWELLWAAWGGNSV